MITRDVSYVLEGPIIVGKNILFIVKSELNSNVSYRVKISPKGILSRSKIEQYKNFTYKCECPAKKVGLICTNDSFIIINFNGCIIVYHANRVICKHLFKIQSYCLVQIKPIFSCLIIPCSASTFLMCL